MIFLVDENLPLKIPQTLREKGLQAYHVKESPQPANRSISDREIRHFLQGKDAVLITKDRDFVDSYLAQNIPDKLIFVYGEVTSSYLDELFQSRHHEILDLLRNYTLIEIGATGLRTPLPEFPD